MPIDCAMPDYSTTTDREYFHRTGTLTPRRIEALLATVEQHDTDRIDQLIDAADQLRDATLQLIDECQHLDANSREPLPYHQQPAPIQDAIDALADYATARGDV